MHMSCRACIIKPIKSNTMECRSSDNTCTGTDVNDDTEDTGSVNCTKSHKMAVKTTTNVSATGQVSSRKKKSTFLSHPWIMKVTDGYLCRLCSEYLSKERGKWITDPVSVKASRKLYVKANKHASSTWHQMSVAAANMKKDTDVAAQIITQAQAQSDDDKQNILRLFRLAYFLFSQEIPHTTNWRALISSVSHCLSDCTLSQFIRNAPGNAHHLSEGAVTSIMEAFGTAIAQSLKKRLTGVTEYAVMADECTDINTHEVVSVCTRFIANGAVIEMFIGCWPVKSTAAVDVRDCILRALKSVGLDPGHMVSVAFDGAANMSGKKGGVQALLKHSPNLIYVHCRSHLLQLALVRAAEHNPAVIEY